METIPLKKIKRSTGLTLGNNRYRLEAGQTSIDLPADDAYQFRALFGDLIDGAAVKADPKKKPSSPQHAVVVADANAKETSL